MLNELIAYLTHPDGTKFQVLTDDKLSLDSEATKEAYNQYATSHPYTTITHTATSNENPERVV